MCMLAVSHDLADGPCKTQVQILRIVLAVAEPSIRSLGVAVIRWPSTIEKDCFVMVILNN